MTENTQTTSGLLVKKPLVVECDVDHAFDVFTRGIGSWWNPQYHIGAAQLADVVVEPRVGGRWYERGVDGSECEWGHVIEWEPPTRVVLAWQIDADWHYDPNLTTELEVRFTPEGENRTRVVLEHRYLERYGARAHEMHGALDSEGGWGGLLASFVAVAGSS